MLVCVPGSTLYTSPMSNKAAVYIHVNREILVTVGERSFASAGTKLWNSLLDDITSASSLTVFRHLFRQSYPDIIL